jgi:hypothetical protein
VSAHRSEPTPRGAEPTTLSSAQTFVMKFVFPSVWIGVFAIGTLALFLLPDPWHGTDGAPPDPRTKWFFLLATLLGTGFIWWLCIPLKRVRMDSTALYVSNYATDIVVPLTSVAEVTENRWVNIHPVTIHFHADTEFGSEVTFMPKVRWFALWTSHPVVEEIRRAATRATGRDRIR